MGGALRRFQVAEAIAAQGIPGLHICTTEDMDGYAPPPPDPPKKLKKPRKKPTT